MVAVPDNAFTRSSALRMQVSMPSPSTSILRMPSASRSSLSHSTKVRSGIARIADRHHLVEPAARDDEAADVLRQMAREAVDLARERRDLPHAPAVRIEPGARDGILRHRAAAAAPDRGRQRADGVLGQAEGLADLADRRAAAIGDHGRGDAGALAAVFVVDVLDHLLAPLVLEIDVDVGRLVALGRDEALEQQIAAVGIDLGDAEADSRPRNWRPSRGPGRGCPASARSARCRRR